MALVIPREVYSWLISLKILQNVDMDSAPLQQVLYNDTIYLENGYLIGKLLRVILKQH